MFIQLIPILYMSLIGVFGVNISDFTVPNTHIISQLKNPEDLILRCKYKVSEKDTGVVLKVHHNENQIFQIIEGKEPYIVPNMKDEIKSTYNDLLPDHKRFVEITLINPTWRSSGNYTCTVQSFQSSDSKSANVQIVDISKANLDITHRIMEDYLEITCKATNIFPQPNLLMRLNNNDLLPTKLEKIRQAENGFYDITTSTVLNDSIDPYTDLSCLLFISGINHSISEVQLFADNGANKTYLCIITLIFLILKYVVF